MKVLMITTSYPDHEGSNRGIFIRRLCRELVNQGIEIVVLTPRVFRQTPLFEAETGMRVFRFTYPSNDTPLNQLESIPILTMVIYMLSAFFMSLRLVLIEKPDVIHGNWIVPTGLIASLAGILTNTPVINTARGLDMRVSEKGPLRFLFDLAVKLSDKVTVVSEAMKERKVLRKAEVITSGVNDTFFKIVPGRHSKSVLYTRSLERVYDAETLIRSIPLVLHKIPDAKFIITGTGSRESVLKRTVDELDVSDKVCFLGTVPHERITEIMGDAAVYVSTAIADGTSIALLEAIAAGLTPVATDIEANRSLISHGKDGYLFRCGDEHALANVIIKALSEGISSVVLDKKRSSYKDIVCWSSVANRFISNYNQLAQKACR